MLVLASYVCLGLIAIESLVVFNIWNWPEVRSRLEGRRAAVKRHTQMLKLRMAMSARNASGGPRRSISLSRLWNKGGGASEGGDSGCDIGRGEGERGGERGWASQLMSSIARKRSATGGGGGGVGRGRGVGGSRGAANDGGGGDDGENDDGSPRDRRALAGGRRGGALADSPAAGDGGAATGGASGSSGAGQLPLPLPPRNGAVAPPRASFAATAAAVASPSGASPSAVGGGDALFLESELEKALYHWRAWKIDVVSFYVIGSLYLLVAVLIFVGSIMASRKSARSVSYAS
mgnify:CR=1 FL=1